MVTMLTQISDEAVVAPAATMTDNAGNILNLDQNAIEENGLIYVPNAAAVIKDGQVFIPNLLAVKDEVTGNYYTDSTKLTQIPDVILNGTQVMTLDPKGKVNNTVRKQNAVENFKCANFILVTSSG